MWLPEGKNLVHLIGSRRNGHFKGELKVIGSNLINKYVIEDEALERNKNAAQRPWKAQVEEVGGIMSRREDKVGNGVKDNLEEPSPENGVQ